MRICFNHARSLDHDEMGQTCHTFYKLKYISASFAEKHAEELLVSPWIQVSRQKIHIYVSSSDDDSDDSSEDDACLATSKAARKYPAVDKILFKNGVWCIGSKTRIAVYAALCDKLVPTGATLVTAVKHTRRSFGKNLPVSEMRPLPWL